MRVFPIAALLAVSVAVAQDSPFKKGEDLQAEIRSNCTEGCVVFNPQEAVELERQIQELVTRKMQEAYEAGRAEARQQCVSLI